MSPSMASFRRELNRALSVLVVRVDLMLLDAEQHDLPPNVLEDLAVLQRHLERLRRLEAFLADTAEPDRGPRIELDEARS